MSTVITTNALYEPLTPTRGLKIKRVHKELSIRLTVALGFMWVGLLMSYLAIEPIMSKFTIHGVSVAALASPATALKNTASTYGDGLLYSGTEYIKNAGVKTTVSGGKVNDLKHAMTPVVMCNYTGGSASSNFVNKAATRFQATNFGTPLKVEVGDRAGIVSGYVYHGESRGLRTLYFSVQDTFACHETHQFDFTQVSAEFDSLTNACAVADRIYGGIYTTGCAIYQLVINDRAV